MTSAGAGGADAFHQQQQQVSKDEQDLHPHVQRMPTQHLIRRLQQWNDELVVHTSVISKNTDRLLRGGMQAAQHYQRAGITAPPSPALAAPSTPDGYS